MRITVLSHGCSGSLNETMATLLFNALHPRKRISLIDTDSKDARLDIMANFFDPTEGIRCPSSLLNNRITNSILSMTNKYEYLKEYLG